MFRKFRAFEASGSYSFVDPDTGHKFAAPKLDDLYRDINNYRRQNRLEEIESLPLVVENYLCGLPENQHKCQPMILHRSITEYIRGGIHLIRNLAFPKFAKQEVAEARASQCIKCPLNIFPNKDHFVAWSDGIAIKEVGERRTSVHEQLGSCAGCGCPLKSKVFVAGPLKPFKDEEVKLMRPVGCWQLGLSGQDK